MTRGGLAGSLGIVLGVASCWAADSKPGPVTFYKDVLAILQNKCQSCHSPGQIAPISFVTYRETKPWAERIKNVVQRRGMPPWSPGVHNLSLSTHRMLTPEETETLVKWVDQGALPGDPRDAPPPLYDRKGVQA